MAEWKQSQSNESQTVRGSSAKAKNRKRPGSPHTGNLESDAGPSSESGANDRGGRGGLLSDRVSGCADAAAREKRHSLLGDVFMVAIDESDETIPIYLTQDLHNAEICVQTKKTCTMAMVMVVC